MNLVLLLTVLALHLCPFHSVPPQSQWGLRCEGRYISTGCGPTVVEMVLDFYGPSMTAQEILDANYRQGQFWCNAGMSLSSDHDEVQSLGYNVEDRFFLSTGELKHLLDEGPAIVVIRMGMSTSGRAHYVVAKGYDETYIHVNDPWCGCSRSYTWARFESSWGSDFNGLTRMAQVIRP
jgi:predicted double-glycine peptidase